MRLGMKNISNRAMGNLHYNLHYMDQILIQARWTKSPTTDRKSMLTFVKLPSPAAKCWKMGKISHREVCELVYIKYFKDEKAYHFWGKIDIKMVGFSMRNRFVHKLAKYIHRHTGQGGRTLVCQTSSTAASVVGGLPRENFWMYSLANAISRVLRMKWFLFKRFFAGNNKSFSHDKEDCQTLE
mgnify:CR=1 FL=1